MLSRSLPILMVWVCALCISPAIQAQTGFSTQSLSELQTEAATSKIPYIVYVHQPQVRLCKKMERKTWSSDLLTPFLGEAVLAYKLNPFEGSAELALVQEHAVYAYPTVLFFHPNGQLMGKAEGFLAPETVHSMLEKHLATLSQQEDIRLWALHNRKAEAVETSMIAAAEIKAPETEAMSLSLLFVPENTDEALPEESLLSAPVAMLENGGNMRTRGLDDKSFRLILEVPGLETYSLSTLQLPKEMPLSYGLLIGSYTSYSALKTELSRMERFWRDEIWVYCEEVNKIPIYKLVLGVYPSEEDAETFAHAIYKIQGLNPIVLDLSVFTDRP